MKNLWYKNLQGYINLIEEWNKKLNLISYKNKQELIINHILDSLSIVEVFSLDNEEIIVDLGTGSGLPGIPLSIIYPHKKFYLVESKKKYIMFLKKVIETLNLKNISLFYGRMEDFSKIKCEVDIILNRAVGDIKKVFNIVLPFTKVNSKVIFYKGMTVFYELNKYKEFLKDKGFEILILRKSKLLKNMELIIIY